MKLNTRTFSIFILLLALIVSGYLSWLKIANANAVCIHGGAFDCGTVLHSKWSEINNIPIAWLGFFTNLLILALILREKRVPLLQESGAILIFGVVLFAFLYSVYLVYLQAFRIQAYCVWCLTHEALIAVLFVAWLRETLVTLNE
ncbi:MAG UNVERIFIED_CONTAM: vitamin K epoxide reductase family protein [Anaerolineae bacterium]|jgi:uncharacterized membrane protein